MYHDNDVDNSFVFFFCWFCFSDILDLSMCLYAMCVCTNATLNIDYSNNSYDDNELLACGKCPSV